MKRAGATTVAAAAAVALTAGLTTPYAAQAEQGASTARAAGTQRVRLITGDRVLVDRKGRVRGVEQAEGRERIPVQTLRADGRTYVVPLDARPMLADGRIDRRLFDITELTSQADRAGQAKGLKVIVGYRGAAAGAREAVRDAGATKVRRTLKSLNAEALTAPSADAAELWRALTREHTAGARTAAAGVDRIWLDGVRKASLDKSTRQIGADKAWAAGYDGKGVKIAVLDTGVDQTHPDLADQEIAEQNFSGAADAEDRYGHGTHVASIAAGTGAKSGGTFKGVAPGARVLDGKVLDDGGSGDDSGIIAGIEWAVAEGADVVNLSLGGSDTPGVDPLEAAVNKFSADNGTLFAIAAGNDGPGAGSVGSPGSADAALTVGAVDDKDALAEFSSRGPRVGDGAVKPDVTAPGVDTTAAAAPGSVLDQEVGQDPEGYLTISGTSMATPHVAGAAALLKQRHPDWKQPELKGALTASTEPGAYSAFEQGSGRIAVHRALEQTVIAEPVSVSFGVAQWPHTDDEPITRKVTYRNLGTKDVTLDLTATGTNPKGDPAPKGFFTLGARQLTVPAGGTASADVTANPRLGGTVDGAYSAHIVAGGGGQSVRTAAALDREVESYDLTLKATGRDGKPAPNAYSFLLGVSGPGADTMEYPYDPSGTVTLRLPKGGYVLESMIAVAPDDAEKGLDALARPKLDLAKDTTLDLDARTAKPVDVKVFDRGAKNRFASMSYDLEGEDWGFDSSVVVPSFAALRTRHLGPKVADGLTQSWAGQWVRGTGAEYDVAVGGKVDELATGYRRTVQKAELAAVRVGLGASSAGRTGGVWAYGWLPGSSSMATGPVEQKLPAVRTLYVSAVDKAQWSFDMDQYGGKDPEGFPVLDASYSMGPQTFKAGKAYEKVFNTGVFGPRVGAGLGVFREGDTLYGSLPLFADGKGHVGASSYKSVRTTLYRDDEKVAETDDPLDGSGQFTVPAGDAAYKLTTSVQRDPKLARVSSRIDASWTFRSKRAESATLPVSTARFGPKLGLTSTAPAGESTKVPVTVQGAAAGGNLKSLFVYASYDYGQTWKRLDVQDGEVTVKNPAKGKGIAFHAKVTDKKGNKATVSIYDAYRGR